jgi:hypothetical protein
LVAAVDPVKAVVASFVEVNEAGGALFGGKGACVLRANLVVMGFAVLASVG